MFPSLRQHADWVLLFVRLVLAAVFLYHGYQKWSIWAGIPEGMPVWLGTTFQVLSVVEPLVGLALLAGLVTQWAALAAAVIMVGAIAFKMFMMRIPFAAGNTTGWEFDLALLALSLVVLAHGAGSLSADAKMGGKKKKK